MTSTLKSARPRRRLLGGAIIAGAALTATLGVQPASAASAQIQGTTLVVAGDSADDRVALRLEAAAPNNLQVDFGDDGTAEATVDRATFDRILINTRRGDDRVRMDEANGVFTDTEITTIAGGQGDDTLLGGRGSETFFGGYGDDTVDGNAGNDLAFMGHGDDTFIWDPGDGSDVIEGQRGDDTMDFRGSAGNEVFDASANGTRLRFFRDLGNIVMDTNDLERVKLTTLAGTDAVTVNDLRRTDVRRVTVDLAAALAVPGADGQADAVTVNATPGNDEVTLRAKGGAAVVSGLAATVVVANADPTLDTLTVNAVDGDDTFRIGKGVRALIKTAINA